MLPEALRADLNRYLELLKERFATDLVSVVVFGSWARGEVRLESDIDLLVVARGLPRSRMERSGILMGLARQVSSEFVEAVSLVALTPEEAKRVKPYYLGMLSGHVILRDANRFFGAVLDRLRQRLAELGARRYVDRDGYEYWDLKPDWKLGDVVELCRRTDWPAITWPGRVRAGKPSRRS